MQWDSWKCRYSFFVGISCVLTRHRVSTTNAVESIHSSFRKVTKQGAFPNEDALLKVLYLRIRELYRKWEGGNVRNWAMVRNQLDMDPKIQPRLRKYEGM